MTDVHWERYPLVDQLSVACLCLQILADFALLRDGLQQQEVYSIDECFLDLSHIPSERLLDYGRQMQGAVLHTTGIPVRVGIAPTKYWQKLRRKSPNASPSMEM